MRYISTLAAGLHEQGHRVTVGCRPKSVLIEETRRSACPFDGFHFKGGLRPGAWTHDLHTAGSFLKNSHPDIIHVNGSQDHWTMALANQVSGHTIPLLRTRHNTYAVSANPANIVLNRKLTDFQIVVCDTVRQSLAKHPAFRADRLCSIHNGVDTDLYHRDEEIRSQARQEFGCESSDLVCGIVARLVPAKGHIFLFEAAALLKNEVPNLLILVFGQGVLEKELRQRAAALGISSRVRFLGFRDDMHYCVQAFDIGVQPSIDCDTSSFSMKEQMAACIPVVASDYGGLHEIIDDGKEGFIVPHGTSAPLAAAIKNLSASSELRRRLGQNARERACKEFSSASFVQRTVETYRRVLETFHKNNTPGQGL